MSRRGCKPNSVYPAEAGERVICLSGRYPAPARRSGPGTGRSKAPYLALLPGRFSVPRRLRDGRWAFTPPFHPCRSPCGPRRFVFCGTVCRGALSRPAPACIPGRAKVTRPRALWSSDFPPAAMPRATLRPSGTWESLPGSARRPSGFSRRICIFNVGGNVLGMVLDVVGRKFIALSNKTASRVGLGVDQQKSEVKTPGFFLSAFGKPLGREDGHGWMAGL